MNKSTSFFSSDPSNNSAYVNVRDRPHLKNARSFVENLWTEYKVLADRHFLIDAKEHFLQRFWEMYVAVTFKKKGMEPVKVSNEGPEFYFLHGNKQVWVEAVAPELGTGLDAVPKPLLGEACDVPEERILLRYTNALAEKLKKYEQAVEKHIIAPDDHYIIALNCRGIPHAPYGGALPYGIMACLSFGHPMISIDKKTMGMVDSYFDYRNQVVKKSGEPIETNLFLDSKYKGITGLLHSAVDPVNRPVEMGGDFWFLHNPSALAPFGESPFQFCRQYFYEEPNLRTVEANKSM
jgi:type I restriction enzyme S subunit